MNNWVVRFSAVAMTVVFASTSVFAAPITVTDVVTMSTESVFPSQGPPTLNVSQLSLGNTGHTYLNFTGANNAGGITVGTTVNSISASLLGPVESSGVNHLGTIGPNGGQIVGISSIQGTVTNVSGPTGGTTFFHTGRVQVVEIDPSAGFNATDLSSWNFNNQTGNGTVLAEYVIKLPEPIIRGNQFDPDGPGGVPLEFAEPFDRPASDVNVGDANISLGGMLQTLLLFEEDPNGQTFFTSTSGLGPILLGTGLFESVLNESLIINSAQQVLSEDQSILTPGDEALLQAIGNYGFGADFADLGGGGFDDFIIDFTDFGGSAGGPDFIANTGGNVIPGLQLQTSVPEPSTIVIWSLLGVVAFGIARNMGRRRRA